MIKFALFILFTLLVAFAPLWMSATSLAGVFVALMLDDKKKHSQPA